MRLNLFSLKVLYYFPRDLVKKSCLYVFLSCLNLIIYQLIHTFGPVRSLFVEPPPTGAQTSSSPEPALIETNPTGWSATPTCHILAGCCWKKKIQDINQHLMKDFRKKKQPLIFRLLLFPDGTPQYDIGSGSGSGELPPDGMSDQSLPNHTELKSFTFFY